MIEIDSVFGVNLDQIMEIKRYIDVQWAGDIDKFIGWLSNPNAQIKAINGERLIYESKLDRIKGIIDEKRRP